MDVSTRPSQEHRQRRQPMGRRLAVFVFSTALVFVPASTYSAAPASEPASPEVVSSIAQDASHEVAIRNVDAGREHVSLTARLSTLSNTLAEDIAWEIRSSSGEVLFKETHTEFNASLPPGEFIVEARYGAVNIRETLTLLQGHALSVNFILNAGGLRVLPLIKGIEGANLESQTLVYALTGPTKGKLITQSLAPGEIIKLAAGAYRVESRYGQGNTVAVADVRVKPGRMSAVEVKHQAGVARLSFVGSAEANVDWSISHVGGQIISQASGLNQSIALRPGMYLAEARVNGETLTAKFKIDAGQERDILLGN